MRDLRGFQADFPASAPHAWVAMTAVTAEEAGPFAAWASERYPGTALDMAAQGIRIGFRAADRAARAVRWRYVSGGRAAHAFVGDADTPLCGVVPDRANGLPARWNPNPEFVSFTMLRRRRGWHSQCVYLAREGGHPL
jgi:hypothetical protein